MYQTEAVGSGASIGGYFSKCFYEEEIDFKRDWD